MTIRKRGFYPWGKGEIFVEVTPVPGLHPVTMLERGLPASIEGVAYAGGTGRRVIKDVIIRTRQLLREKFGEAIAIQISLAPEDDGADSEPVKAPQSQTTGSGGLTYKERRALADEARKKVSGVAGIQLVLHTTTGCRIAADCLMETVTDVSAAEVLLFFVNWDCLVMLPRYLKKLLTG